MSLWVERMQSGSGLAGISFCKHYAQLLFIHARCLRSAGFAAVAHRLGQERESIRIRWLSTCDDTSSQACSIHETGEGSPLDDQLHWKGVHPFCRTCSRSQAKFSRRAGNAKSPAGQLLSTTPPKSLAFSATRKGQRWKRFEDFI